MSLNSVGLSLAPFALAHVQVLLPEEEALGDARGDTLTLDIRFTSHATKPGEAMSMAKPGQFGVLLNGKKIDLLDSLTVRKVDGQTAFSCRYKFKEAGAHVFFLEPAPYWDEEEQVMIVHQTKVIVDSAGMGLATESDLGWENWEGWEAMVGFSLEIEPLVQPSAMWTGNVFRGW